MKQLLAVSLWAIVSGSEAVSVSVPAAVPTGASRAIENTFLGLGVESWSFPNYTSNEFSINMFNSLSSRTGALPIRIGGDTADLVLYVPSQTEPVVIGTSTNAVSNTFTRSTFGKSYFDGFKSIKNARYVYQVPLLRNNLTNAVVYAQAALDAMGVGSFGAFEIGNEPSQYGDLAPMQFGAWGAQAYDAAWKNWTDTLIAQVTNLPKNRQNFWALSLVWPSGEPFTIQTTFKDGLEDDTAAMKAVSQHYYQANGQLGSAVLAKSLMNHTATVNTMKFFAPQIAYLKNNTNSTVPLVLGEVGHAPCGNDPACTIPSSFGSAIWAVDFMLHGMVEGVQRVNLQNIDFSYGAGWRPVPYFINGQVRQPEVLGTFYGEVFIADLINQTTTTRRVAEFGVSDNVVTYGIYDAGKISKVVILNENVYLSTDTGTRPNTSVMLTGLTGVKSVKVQRLDGAFADLNENITWAGQQWSFASKGLPVQVKNDTMTVQVANGVVSLSTQASEVLMVTVQS